ncbi:MAG: extracellular solute-binding protein [Planctomycetes bacterium]|nr:extracellular solute-binding protein [Planctomycetota bacterium]
MSRIRSLLVAAAFLPFAACGDGPGKDSKTVSLYCALDQEHSETLVQLFEKETSIDVKTRFDTEASKTVGLVSSILDEAQRPRCDVFWNNELAHTVRLGQKGMLEPYVSPAAAAIPDRYKDKDGKWTGFAARARVLIVNTELVAPEEYPKSVWDLIDPKWKGKCAIAKPVTGTTLTHFTTLALKLGVESFARLTDGMKANDVVILASNGATMKEVASGKLHWAFTDTDDFHVALKKGHKVACVFPDQGENELGTMLIPNSVALIRGGPNPEAGKKLIDFIVSERVEAMLASAKSAQIPLRSEVQGPSEKQILKIGQFKEMPWDPAQTAQALASMSKRFESLFDR